MSVLDKHNHNSSDVNNNNNGSYHLFSAYSLLLSTKYYVESFEWIATFNLPNNLSKTGVLLFPT